MGVLREALFRDAPKQLVGTVAVGGVAVQPLASSSVTALEEVADLFVGTMSLIGLRLGHLPSRGSEWERSRLTLDVAVGSVVTAALRLSGLIGARKK